MTSFNSAQTLGATLRSLAEQKYANLEVILIDGGSTDGTQAIANGFSGLIHKFISEPDRGSSDALNKGFRLATGDIVTFLNSDDTLASPDAISWAVEAFQKDPKIAYVGGAIQWVEPETGEKTKICQSRPDQMLWGCNAFLPGGFFRRDIIKDPPFTDEIDFANDYDLLCDVLVGEKAAFATIPQVVLFFTLGGRSNLSHNRIRGKHDLFLVRRKYFGLFLALAFAVPELTVAWLQQLGFRPFTWMRRLRRPVSPHQKTLSPAPNSNLNSKKSFYIAGFDGLRALSIGMVFLGHLGLASHLPETSFWRDRFFALCSGATGVRFFFVISGFLITYLLLEEQTKLGRIQLGQFYLRRALRLFPALVVLVLANAAMMVAGVYAKNWIGLLLGSLYVINFAPLIFMSNTLSHLWSLAVEEQFYLLWPAILVFARPRWATVVALGLIGASAFLTLSPPNPLLDIQAPWLHQLLQLAHIDPSKYQSYFTEGRYFKLSQAFYLDRWTLPAIGFILIGCIAALIEKGLLRERTTPLRPAVMIFVGLFMAPLYWPENSLPLASLVQAVGIGVLVLALFQNQNSRLVQTLEFAPLRMMGKISYGLYLWQGFFVTTGPGSSIWFQQAPQNVILSFGVAILSYRLIEQPFLRLKERLRTYGKKTS